MLTTIGAGIRLGFGRVLAGVARARLKRMYVTGNAPTIIIGS